MSRSSRWSARTLTRIIQCQQTFVERSSDLEQMHVGTVAAGPSHTPGGYSPNTETLRGPEVVYWARDSVAPAVGLHRVPCVVVGGPRLKLVQAYAENR